MAVRGNITITKPLRKQELVFPMLIKGAVNKFNGVLRNAFFILTHLAASDDDMLKELPYLLKNYSYLISLIRR
jgi:hypothetical protein